ncbi:DUF397 domain-containing protein [Streptomyces sp. H39-S7]|uniref:DUF397 domain-containing protein n=1 Tax=Streptomyces sp. H39-S7 TaxID=3004357 RepID=UPI0022AEC198|nr:DUF397 domain-containing protein [Streptomyces sp. H39-S7]MCZ4125490.1 DUF397 domain-containing protein [Streptomyces sp. H39-S7]
MSQLQWQKSSFSDSGGANCVEVAAVNGTVMLRESDAPGVVLSTSPIALGRLLANIKAGELDGLAI